MVGELASEIARLVDIGEEAGLFRLPAQQRPGIDAHERLLEDSLLNNSKPNPDGELGPAQCTLKYKASGIVIHIQIAITDFRIDITGYLAA